MNPPELASEPVPCYARRGRIERPALSYVCIQRPSIKITYPMLDIL